MRKANPILVLVLFLSLASPSIMAQRGQDPKSHSEIRESKQKAQRDAKIFGKSDKEFENTEIPGKWKDESAVVLARKIEYIYANEKKEITFEKIYRSRVKLLDQAAVELYSEFYFIATNEIGIRIIKPDGATDIVETSQAIEVENSVKIPKEFFSLKVKYKKLAVPNLEVGDIIDYY
ncbi:MAG: hypothetical protein GXO89_14450, partial [Chlorobi bacterium]|nr:hypothetical protein [Chlorobiota bacterium]